MQALKDILKKLKRKKAGSKTAKITAALAVPKESKKSKESKESKDTKEPKMYFLKQCKDTAFHTAAFLESEDIHNLVRASKGVLNLYKDSLNYKKLFEPLRQVLKANPKKVISIIPTISPEYGCVVLKRMSSKQSYFSKKLNQTVTISEWNDISPLEAAAHCLDTFMVNELIKFIPEDAKLLEEAITQLQGVLNTKEPKKDTHDSIEAEETKTPAERIYLAPYKNLLKAYKPFDDRVDLEKDLHGEHSGLYTGCKWDFTLLNKLWSEVWEAQRKLPTYGLQELCDKKPFFPLWESFQKEPSRACKIFDKNTELDLDLDGHPKDLALYKGFEDRGWASGYGAACGYGRDSEAFERLCQERTDELLHIIEMLRIRLETAEVLADCQQVFKS